MNSSELKGYLTGLIFGDGYIDKGVTKRSFRLRTINKGFAEKIYNDLSSCTNFDIKIIHHDAYYGNGCNHKEHWEIYIKAHPYFAKKYHHFYDDYKHRTASVESLSWINEAGLANWYMSDGYVCLVGKTKGYIRDRRVDICTDRYQEKTVEAMMQMLDKKFGVKTSKIKRNNTYRIRIKSESYKTFFEIVLPHLTEDMKYKAYLGYECQPKWMSDEMWNLQSNLQSAIALTSNVEG